MFLISLNIRNKYIFVFLAHNILWGYFSSSSIWSYIYVYVSTYMRLIYDAIIHAYPKLFFNSIIYNYLQYIYNYYSIIWIYVYKKIK